MDIFAVKERLEIQLMEIRKNIDDQNSKILGMNAKMKLSLEYLNKLENKKVTFGNEHIANVRKFEEHYKNHAKFEQSYAHEIENLKQLTSQYDSMFGTYNNIVSEINRVKRETIENQHRGNVENLLREIAHNQKQILELHRNGKVKTDDIVDADFEEIRTLYLEGK